MIKAPLSPQPSFPIASTGGFALEKEGVKQIIERSTSSFELNIQTTG